MRTTNIPNLYRTSDIARILGVEEWRVKNFTQGVAYKLPASLRVGNGKRRARLYTFDDVQRMAVATELVKYGFTPEAVGDAMGVLTTKFLSSWSAPIAEAGKKGQEPQWSTLPMLARIHGQWKIIPGSKFRDAVLGFDSDWRGAFVLNLCALLGQIARKMTELEATKE